MSKARRRVAGDVVVVRRRWLLPMAVGAVVLIVALASVLTGARSGDGTTDPTDLGGSLTLLRGAASSPSMETQRIAMVHGAMVELKLLSTLRDPRMCAAKVDDATQQARWASSPASNSMPPPRC